MPQVSIVIPCFNQGAYLDESVDSVLAQSYQDLEIIVVNDGSTDPLTIEKINTFKRSKTRVLTTSNKGLAAARNYGIAAAAGQYILPLDADDRIEGDYISEAVEILDRQPEVGIVYCRAQLFGAVETEWLLPDYSLEEMVKDNVIFCSAFFRRKDWEQIGGYDTEMVYGWEDYDFWLSLIERGREVRQLPGRYFHYRVAADSMVRSRKKEQKVEMFVRIYQRHQEFIAQHIDIWLNELIDIREKYHSARLYVDNGRGFSEHDSLARKVSQGRQTLHFDLSGFNRIKGLRFDPVDCPASVRIETVVVAAADRKQVISPASLIDNGVCRNDTLCWFADADPQIIIELPDQDLAGLDSVQIEFEITALGEAALQEAIGCLKTKCRDRGSTGESFVTTCRRVLKRLSGAA